MSSNAVYLSQMKLAGARRAAIIDVVDEYDSVHINDPTRNIPMDVFLRFWFLKRKNLFDD